MTGCPKTERASLIVILEMAGWAASYMKGLWSLGSYSEVLLYLAPLICRINLCGYVCNVQFEDKTPFSIMFGPDRCGSTSKLHFIVQFKNPVTGEVEEKHSKQSAESTEFFLDKKTHLFTLCEW